MKVLKSAMHMGLVLFLAGCERQRADLSTGRLWFDPDDKQAEDFVEPPEIVGDWIAVEHDVWMDLVGQTGRHLHSAMVAVREEQWADAAKALKRGAAHLRLEIGRADGHTGLALHVASAELYQLARRCRERPPVPAARLRSAFVHAHYALALHHGENLKSGDRTTRTFALALKATAINLGQIATWKEWPATHPSRKSVEQGLAASDWILKHRSAPPNLDVVLDDLDEALSLIGLQLQSEASDDEV